MCSARKPRAHFPPREVLNHQFCVCLFSRPALGLTIQASSWPILSPAAAGRISRYLARGHCFRENEEKSDLSASLSYRTNQRSVVARWSRCRWKPVDDWQAAISGRRRREVARKFQINELALVDQLERMRTGQGTTCPVEPMVARTDRGWRSSGSGRGRGRRAAIWAGPQPRMRREVDSHAQWNANLLFMNTSIAGALKQG